MIYRQGSISDRQRMGRVITPQGYRTKTKTLFTLGPLLNGVGGIYTTHLCKTRDSMVEEGRKEMFYLTTHSINFIYG